MTEHQEQVALMQWVTMRERLYPKLRLLHAIPNGGQRHKVVAARLKAEGVKAGVPDLCLPVARNGYHGLYIEMKTAKGTMSASQKRWANDLKAEGYRVELCRGWQQAKQVLSDYMDIHS